MVPHPNRSSTDSCTTRWPRCSAPRSRMPARTTRTSKRYRGPFPTLLSAISTLRDQDPKQGPAPGTPGSRHYDIHLCPPPGILIRLCRLKLFPIRSLPSCFSSELCPTLRRCPLPPDSPGTSRHTPPTRRRPQVPGSIPTLFPAQFLRLTPSSSLEHQSVPCSLRQVLSGPFFKLSPGNPLQDDSFITVVPLPLPLRLAVPSELDLSWILQSNLNSGSSHL